MTTTPRTLTVTECHQLLNTLVPEKSTHKQHLKAIRNYAMALLMLDAGLRVGEVVSLTQQDLTYPTPPISSVTLQPHQTKNKKERTIPLSSRLQAALDEMDKKWWWPTGRLLHYYAFYRTDPRTPITTRQVERIIRRAALKCIGRPIHPHVLRHTFASRLMRKVNIRIVQELLGHTRMSSTQIYTHPSQDDLKDAIAQLGVGDIETELWPMPLASGPDSANRTDTPDTNSNVR
ncbi:Tyrosine recombinase XerC [subsurface metagenome]